MKTFQLCLCFAFVVYVCCDIGFGRMGGMIAPRALSVGHLAARPIGHVSGLGIAGKLDPLSGLSRSRLGMSQHGGLPQTGYVGRSAMTPALKKPTPFSPLGKTVAEPKWVRDLIGKTIGDGPMIGGIGGLPRHGGAGPGMRFASGLRNGWGDDDGIAMHPSVSAWEDPLNNLPFPTGYKGEDLIMDPTASRWIHPKAGAAVGHKVPKKTGYGRRRMGIKPKPIMPRAVLPHKSIMPKPLYPKQPIMPKPILPAKPIYPKQPIMPHKPMYPKRPIMPKPIMPKPIKPIYPKNPIVPKKPVMPMHGMKGIGGPGFLSGGAIGGLGGVGGGFPAYLIGGTFSGQPIIGGIDGFPRHGGAGAGERFRDGLRDGWGADHSLTQVEAVSAWQDPLNGLRFPQGYGGGELVLDPTGQHYIEKQMGGGALGGAGLGVGGIGHDIAKATGGVGPIGHNIAKASGVIGGTHIGLSGVRNQLSPVHNVEKALSTGKVQSGHDMLAVGIGQDIARHAAANAESTIDMGSNGALSRGSPLAGAAAHGLAKESVHVAGKLLNKADNIGRSGSKMPGIGAGIGLGIGPGIGAGIGPGIGLGMGPRLGAGIGAGLGAGIGRMSPIMPPIGGGGGYGRSRRRMRDW